MASKPTLIHLQQVSKRYSARGGLWTQAVAPLSISVKIGEIVALVGASGSGKSTLGRIMVGLERPDEGIVSLKGEEMITRTSGAVSPRFRRRVQMVFQDPYGSLNPVHRIRYPLERALKQRKSPVDAEALLEQVQLPPDRGYLDRYPHELSGGEAQRVAIARALASGPELLCADEPTAMLDVSIRAEILNLLEELRKSQGLSTVLITHDLAAARYLADRIVVLREGKIVEEGEADAVVSSPQHPYTRDLLNAVPERWE